MINYKEEEDINQQNHYLSKSKPSTTLFLTGLSQDQGVATQSTTFASPEDIRRRVEHLAYHGQVEEAGQSAAFKSVGEETKILDDDGCSFH